MEMIMMTLKILLMTKNIKLVQIFNMDMIRRETIKHYLLGITIITTTLNLTSMMIGGINILIKVQQIIEILVQI